MQFYYLTLRSIIPYMTALLFVIHALLQPLPPDITALFDSAKSVTSVAVATPAVAGMESPPFWFKQKLIESRYQKKQLAKEQRIQRIEQECATRGMRRINRRIEERMMQFVTKEDVEQSKSWAEAMRAEFEAYLAKEKAAEKKARSTFFGSLASVVKDIVAGKQHGQVEEEEAEDGVEENVNQSQICSASAQPTDGFVQWIDMDMTPRHYFEATRCIIDKVDNPYFVLSSYVPFKYWIMPVSPRHHPMSYAHKCLPEQFHTMASYWERLTVPIKQNYYNFARKWKHASANQRLRFVASKTQQCVQYVWTAIKSLLVTIGNLALIPFMYIGIGIIKILISIANVLHVYVYVYSGLCSCVSTMIDFICLATQLICFIAKVFGPIGIPNDDTWLYNGPVYEYGICMFNCVFNTFIHPFFWIWALGVSLDYFDLLSQPRQPTYPLVTGGMYFNGYVQGIEDLHCRIRQERELQLQKQQHRPISPSPSIAERMLSPEYVGYREFFNYIKLRHAELIAEIARSARVLDQLMPESMEDCIYNCNE